MSRPLRIEFPGAVYHVASRRELCEPVYRDDGDRLQFVGTADRAPDRFDSRLLA